MSASYRIENDMIRTLTEKSSFGNIMPSYVREKASSLIERDCGMNGSNISKINELVRELSIREMQERTLSPSLFRTTLPSLENLRIPDLKEMTLPFSLVERAGSGEGGLPGGISTPSQKNLSVVDGSGDTRFRISWLSHFLLLLIGVTPIANTVVFAPLAAYHAVRSYSLREGDKLEREFHSIRSVVDGIFALPVIGNCVAGVELCKRVAALFKERIFSS